ncbi:MAG: MFS transporter, partial [Promethearchaeota archaeon]
MNIKIEEILYAMYHFPIALTSPFISLYYFNLSGGDYLGAGLIISIPYFFLIFSSGFFGRMSDKIGSKNLVLFSLAVFTFSFISYYFIDQNPPLFFLAYVGFNIIISAFTPSFNRIVSFKAASNRGNTFGKLGMWASAGFLVGSFLTTTLIDHLEYRILFLFAAFFAFLAFFTATQLTDNFSSSTELSKEEKIVSLSFSTNLKEIITSMKPIFVLLLLIMLTQTTNSLYISFFAIFVEKELKQPKSMVALVNTIATTIGIFGTFAVGRLVDRYMKKNLIIIALAIYLLLPFLTFILSNEITPLNTILILVLYSIPLYSIFFVVVPVFISENTPDSR